MDKETLQNFLNNISRIKFVEICRITLQEMFALDPINADGKGDAGGDWITIPEGGGKRVFVAQDTIQKSNWKTKALNDAKKAVDELKCTRFIFLTSRVRESVSLRALEEEIIKLYSVPATCLGAIEISDFLLSHKLLARTLDALQIEGIQRLSARVDKKEILLHSYVALGSETGDMRNQIIDDSICLVVREFGSLLEHELVKKTLEEIGCGVEREGKIVSRVQSLLSRRILQRDENSEAINLSDLARTEILTSEAIYQEQLNALASSQASLIQGTCNVDWPIEASRKASVFLARAFIKRQLDTVQSAKATLSPLYYSIGDPLQDLRQFMADSGLHHTQIGSAIEELVQNASGDPLIAKLVRGALYAALEGGNPLLKCAALAVSKWSDVTMYLDASVIIPFLCAKVFQPSHGRFSAGAVAAVETFQKLGVRLVATQDYINEAASHLLNALKFDGIAGGELVLENATNGYVSHYYQLLSMNMTVPKNLTMFLGVFSSALRKEQERERWIRSIMIDIQRLITGYGIHYETLPQIDPAYSDVVDREFAHYLNELNREKVDVLTRHDARMLSYMRKQVVTGHGGQACLTWDRLLIRICGRVEDCGWAVSPHDAVDFAGSSQRIGESKLISLSHRLATSRAIPSELVGFVLDKLIDQSGGGALDWQIMEQLEELRKNLYEKMDTENPNFRAWAAEEAFTRFSDFGFTQNDKSAFLYKRQD